ncbi:Uncharacterized protein dnl_51360 [Desulfonema limicola]|uniref:Antirestriction protein n=1 Tax=Desulfonema limicola TaxID=45656 RepID=A0A975GIV5_9BACT|nr:Uncharacterized protein dnl_51360 [Desulfonema limicola]
MNDNVKNTLTSILDKFETGDIPEVVSYAMFPIPDIPSAKWSLLNRTLMMLSQTADARGFKQWKKVKRYVKKGSKAFYILVPYIKKTEDNGQEKEKLIGFMTRPVFRMEDTDGKELEYNTVKLPELPFMERAMEWGISVKAIPGNYRYYGYYTPSMKVIALATQEEKTFFHELSHVAHEKIKGGLKRGQDALQEIVAELSAQTLCRIAGKQDKDTLGNSYRYIKSYADKLNISPYRACLRVMSDTEKVLNLILKGDEMEFKKVA